MRLFAVAIIMAAGLAGCQTVEQSRYSAGDACQQAGFRPGNKNYNRCVNSRVRQDQNNNAAAGAVVAGAAAGLVGAAIIAGSERDRYYDRGYYRNGGYESGSVYYGTGYYGRSYNPGYYRTCNEWGCN